MNKAPMLLPLLLALVACSNKEPASGNIVAADASAAATIPLTITGKGGTHRFDVEVAATPEQQAQGLMFRTELAPDGGMVFPMQPPRIASFWMKNTVIPLDMLFVRSDGTIASIAASRKPYSREPSSAGIPVAGVLELRGGRAAELGIAEGDKVQWGACAAPAAKPAPSLANVRFCP
ncbi:MAG: DUF192 domain-containing protein [Sphingobium sp.]|uniref:DUF192 domain-containing protein n=1 Tax=Sphingobium sp. TaxID=1912891 RepID=UPI0029B0178B|nr:DUF192 domain-containing protein [Sphingobium sp.]MDX3908618.1 DUF192 domain-containing protein [Sphingobium sp.]